MPTVGSSVPQIVTTVTLNPGNIIAGTYSEETVSVAGSNATQMVLAFAPAIEAGVCLVNARCATAGTVILTFVNMTGADVNPASQTIHIICL